MKEKLKAWWDTAESSLTVHRRTKWIWIWLIPLSYVLRNNVAWVVFMSHYAIIAAHASAEESAKVEVKQEEAHESALVQQ